MVGADDDRADGPLYHQLVGDGRPVLLIQGVGAIGEAWRPQLDGLADGYRMCAYDNRGIGRSPLGDRRLTIELMTRDALALMDHFGWQRCHVAGHSMGGVIAQQLALDAPERVASLALLCTFVRGVDGARPSGRMIWLGLRSRIGTRPMRRRAFVQMIYPRSHIDDIDQNALAADWSRYFGRDFADSPPVIMKQLRAMKAHDASGQLAQLAHIPTLVITGEEDIIAPPSQGRALAEAIPGARYVEMARAGHALPIRLAEATNALLREHFSAAAL